MPFWQVGFLKSELSFSLILFILPGCYYFVVRFHLKLPVSLLFLTVSSCLLYFSWDFFSLYLFILQGSDSLVSVCGHELRDVAAMKESCPSPFPSPHPSTGRENLVSRPRGEVWLSLWEWIYLWRCAPELDTLALTIERWGLQYICAILLCDTWDSVCTLVRARAQLTNS